MEFATRCALTAGISSLSFLVFPTVAAAQNEAATDYALKISKAQEAVDRICTEVTKKEAELDSLIDSEEEKKAKLKRHKELLFKAAEIKEKAAAKRAELRQLGRYSDFQYASGNSDGSGEGFYGFGDLERYHEAQERLLNITEKILLDPIDEELLEIVGKIHEDRSVSEKYIEKIAETKARKEIAKARLERLKINPTGSSITLDKGSGNPGGGAPDGGMLDLNFIETFIAEYEINGRLNAPSSSAFNRDFGRILRNGSEYSTSEVDALAAIRNDSHCADEVIFGATYTIQNYNNSKFGRELKLGDGTDCKAFLTSLENEYELKYRAPDIGFVSVQEPVGYGDSPEILLVGPNVYRPEQKTDGEKGTYTAVEVKCAKRSSDHIFQANYTCSRLFGIEAFIGSTTNPDINLSFGQFVQRPTVKNNITFGIGADYKIASPFSGGHIYAGVEYRRTTGDYNSFINVGPGTVGVAGGSYKNQSYGVNVRLEGDIGERFILGGGFGLFLSDHDLNGAFRANGTNIEAAIEALLHYRLANNISIGPSAHIFIPLDRSLSGGAGATSANPVRFSTTPREIRFGVRFRF